MLDLIESFNFLKTLPIQDYLVINSEADLKKSVEKEKFSFPIFLKISSSEHKLKIGGVKKANDYGELLNYYKLMKTKFPNKKILVQKSMKGIEVIIGVKEDRVFGKLLMIGAGGSGVEKAKDVSFRAFPIIKEEIVKIINDLKISKNFSENEKNLILDFAQKLLKLNLEKVKELDINPLIVNEKEAKIIDARIELD